MIIMAHIDDARLRTINIAMDKATRSREAVYRSAMHMQLVSPASLRSVGRGLVGLACCGLAVVCGSGVARATESSGVSATTFTMGTTAEPIELRQAGPTEVVVREITISPGGSTGWHYHQGALLAVVQSGTLTRQLDDCSEEITTAGQTFVEPSGADHVHIGRNRGSEPVVLYVTYVLPGDAALSVDADDPGCGP
jgi:quercetin dioxygenase-like cupin family protein